MQIDHIPGEKRPTNLIWWIAWTIVAALWLAQWYLDGFDRDQILIGFATGMVFTAWGLDITGNKLPSWMIPSRKTRVREQQVSDSPRLR